MTQQAVSAHVPLDLEVTTADPGVAILRIKRGPHNFFDADLIRRVADQLFALGQQTDIRAAVLCSEGKNFCAGADLSVQAPRPSSSEDLYHEAARLFAQPLPMIAAVQGAAVGGGLGLALSADFRVAGPSSRFSANFAQLGFHHGFGLTLTLPRAVGQQKASELLMTGQRINGNAAFELGLCDRLVDDENILPAAVGFAHELAASAPLAVAAIRRTLRRSLVEQVTAVMRSEAREQERLVLTDDWLEGTAAARERRSPQFRGK